MRVFGMELSLKRIGSLAPVSSRGWWPLVMESFSGAWQHNVVVDQQAVLACNAVFSCITLIAGDIGKLRYKLTRSEGSDIWEETTNPAWSPVLRKPNRYQNHIQFKEWWINSKLIRGNTYALKERDNRGVVVRLYLLDPARVLPLVAEDGSVYYQLGADYLSGVTEDSVTVPASEIIHDRMNCLFHPLVGLSPIYACGLAATQGLSIQNNSATFFSNYSRPSGVLTAPGAIADETANRLKATWEANYSGTNVGKVAVLGDGLKYEPMAVTAVDAQLIEQLKWSAETVCSCFHVPGYMVGVGQMPAYNNIEALNQQYYSQCLQTLIEAMELCLDEGLALPADYGTELDLETLLRMDTGARYKAHSDGIGGGWLSPNEARRKENMKPVKGGESPMLQQQNYSLAALAKRDAMDDPFGKPEPNPDPQPDPVPDPVAVEQAAKRLAAQLLNVKDLELSAQRAELERERAERLRLEQQRAAEPDFETVRREFNLILEESA